MAEAPTIEEAKIECVKALQKAAQAVAAYWDAGTVLEAVAGRVIDGFSPLVDLIAAGVDFPSDNASFDDCRALIDQLFDGEKEDGDATDHADGEE